jgi:Protein of unknown function (DUF4238)
MSTPREHHFIPAFLLKQWGGQNGKLIEYTIKHGKLIAKPVGPHSTGYEVDLYAFNELAPDVRQHIEQQFFNYADNIASIALERHLAGSREPWPPELLPPTGLAGAFCRPQNASAGFLADMVRTRNARPKSVTRVCLITA